MTRSLARNDSAARWERRDTWVPPYGVRRSSRAGGGIRPYKAKQEPRKTGRRGRRPLRNHKGCVQRGGQRRPPLQGRTGAVRNGTSGTPSPTKSQGVCAMGGQRRPPLQGRTGTVRSGTSRTPCPTHSVIARSEATRQSVLPSPKRRIPAPVTRSLVRNDSAPRWERRDTWVPPYGVRRSSRAGRGVRPYKAEQEPCEAGRRGRRPLHTLSLRGAKRLGNPFPKRIIPALFRRFPAKRLRILAPATRSLARNDSAPRWERRDT